jgi:hypothetical protein
MSDTLLHILAEDTGSGGWLRLIVPVLFVLFWILSAIIGSIAKKKEEQERRRRMESMRENMQTDQAQSPMPPPLPPPLSGSGGRVTTRDEMERRMEQARQRRRQREVDRTSEDEAVAQTSPTMTDRPASDMEELSVRAEAERARNDEARLQGEYRRQDEQKRLEQRRRADERVRTLELERQTLDLERQSDPRRDQQQVLTREMADELAGLRNAEKVRQSKRDQQLPSRRKAAPPSLPEVEEVAGRITRSELTTVDRSRSKTDRAPTADATAIRRWLTPATLRQQYMLTELLGPPLALRRDREI